MTPQTQQPTCINYEPSQAKINMPSVHVRTQRRRSDCAELSLSANRIIVRTNARMRLRMRGMNLNLCLLHMTEDTFLLNVANIINTAGSVIWLANIFVSLMGTEQ